MAGWSMGRMTSSSMPATARARAARARQRNLRMRQLHQFAEGLDGGVLQEIGDPGFGEGAFDVFDGVVQAPVQGAQAFVTLEAERAGADAADGIHRVDNIENGDL